MAAIILPGKWRRQPVGPVSVDASNSFANGLVAAVLPVSGQINDALARKTLALSGDAKTGTFRGGQALDLDGTGDYAKLSTYPKDRIVTDRNTLYVEITPNFASSSNTRQGIVHFADAIISGDIARYRLIWLNATLGFYLDTFNGYAYNFVPSFSAGDTLKITFTRSGQSNGAFYLNGVAASTTRQIDLGFGYAISSNPDLYLGLDGENTSWTMAGKISQVCLWDRALNASEVAEFSANQYQIFRKSPQILYFNVAGGGATGSFAVTESGSDTPSFAGDVIVSGSFAVSESGADTPSFAGLTKVSGSFALTESGADTALFEGFLPVEGIPTLTNATVTAVTRTAATPRVTVTFA